MSIRVKHFQADKIIFLPRIFFRKGFFTSQCLKHKFDQRLFCIDSRIFGNTCFKNHVQNYDSIDVNAFIISNPIVRSQNWQ